MPFSLIQPREGGRRSSVDTTLLSEAMGPFFGVDAAQPCGFLDSPAWRVLRKDMAWEDGTRLFVPTPAVLYPAVYDLAERVLAAAKAVRPFAQTEQRGWRCSLTGETEWLTTDEEQLEARPYRRREDTLWAKVAKARPAWAKTDEHLGALPAIKRLWPILFVDEVEKIVGVEHGRIGRFVVSTHTMALAKQIEERVGRGKTGESLGGGVQAELASAASDVDPVALPRKLMDRIGGDHATARWARRLPGALDEAAESGDEHKQRQAESLVKRVLGLDGHKNRIETYYALLLMDGDHMGRILSGDGSTCAITHLRSLHPQVREGFEAQAGGNLELRAYGNQHRAISPNRHLAISAALNDFALHVVPHVVEREFLGRVLYAGGDDVMAMLPVADLLPAMQRLRNVYSGDAPEDAPIDWKMARDSRELVCGDGFGLLRGRLMRLMGGAQASCGAVVAHHQAPLAVVMRELREAEQRAKNEGGRDAFSLTVVKRSGGVLRLTAKWGEGVVLSKLRDFLAAPSVSRRAVYNSLVWLKDLPDDADADMFGTLLGYQFVRQMSDNAEWSRNEVVELASRVAELAQAIGGAERRGWLARFLGVAEFLARETRIEWAGAAGGEGEAAAGSAADC